MSTQYIINNSDSLLTGQTINGELIVTSAVTATTYYGDGSNLTGIAGLPAWVEVNPTDLTIWCNNQHFLW
jgi:hypothetical protein